LAALLLATPTLARWIGLSPTTIGVPVFYLILVFGLRGVRSRKGGGIAARVALALVAMAMMITVVSVVLELPAWMKEDHHPSR
jgi:hypothetical protein